MALVTDGRFKKAPGVSSRVIDGRAVIVVMPRETLHSLNPSGTLLWSSIEAEGQTRSSLRDALASRYDLDQARADSDVDRFLEQLTELGAIEVSTDG